METVDLSDLPQLHAGEQDMAFATFADFRKNWFRQIRDNDFVTVVVTDQADMHDLQEMGGVLSEILTKEARRKVLFYYCPGVDYVDALKQIAQIRALRKGVSAAAKWYAPAWLTQCQPQECPGGRTCEFWDGARCTDPDDFVDANGESVCRYSPDTKAKVEKGA